MIIIQRIRGEKMVLEENGHVLLTSFLFLNKTENMLLKLK
jgi:hypothetical protein